MAFRFLTTFNKYRTPVFQVVALLVIILLIKAIIGGATKPPRIIQLDPITKVIEVPVEKLTIKNVTEYVKVEDRARVTQLLRENSRLNAKVEQLTVALAEHTTTGSGEAVITIPTPATPGTDDVVDAAPAEPITVTFKDWRLDFRSIGTQATYTLSQKFSIINTVARNKNNVPVNLIRLYEIGENGERVEIPTVESTTIAVKPGQPRFYVKGSLQAGAGTSPITREGQLQFDHSAVIALPWLKRGTSNAVETTRYAYLSPAVMINGKEVIAGILPISFNFGTILPLFSDLWASPFVGKSSQSNTGRFGIAFTATF